MTKPGILTRRKFISSAGMVLAAITVQGFYTGCHAENMPKIRIYAIKYGESIFPERYVFYGHDTSQKMPFSWLFYYIEYNGKKILIDTGFNDRSKVETFEIKKFAPPLEILRQNSIKPEDITDVIITHGHFDHAGNAGEFPRSRIIISEDELSLIRKGKYGNKIRNEFRNIKNITSFKENFELYDIFTVKKIGGHTAGSSVVYLNLSVYKICFTGDEVYTKKNLDDGIPNGTVVSLENNKKFINEFDKNIKYMTFHDPEYYGNKNTFIDIPLR